MGGLAGVSVFVGVAPVVVVGTLGVVNVGGVVCFEEMTGVEGGRKENCSG